MQKKRKDSVIGIGSREMSKGNMKEGKARQEMEMEGKRRKGGKY